MQKTVLVFTLFFSQSLLNMEVIQKKPTLIKERDTNKNLKILDGYNFGKKIIFPNGQIGQEISLKLDAEEPLTLNTFQELIQEQEERKLPFLLAITETEDKGNNNIYYHCYDGIKLHRALFGKNLLKNLLYETNLDKKNDPINNQKIKNILYFLINNLEQEKFNYFGSYFNGITSNKANFLVNLFDASENNKISAWSNLGCWYYNEGNVEKAIECFSKVFWGNPS